MLLFSKLIFLHDNIADRSRHDRLYRLLSIVVNNCEISPFRGAALKLFTTFVYVVQFGREKIKYIIKVHCAVHKELSRIGEMKA